MMLLRSLHFSLPPPPRAIIPDARPLGTFENQEAVINGKTRYISTISQKIGDFEQSILKASSKTFPTEMSLLNAQQKGKKGKKSERKGAEEEAKIKVNTAVTC